MIQHNAFKIKANICISQIDMTHVCGTTAEVGVRLLILHSSCKPNLARSTSEMSLAKTYRSH